MPFQNWAMIIAQIQNDISTIDTVKSAVMAASDLNLSNEALPLSGETLSKVTDQLGITSAVTANTPGLSVLSNVSSLSTPQLKTLSDLTGVSTDTILGLSSGNLPASDAIPDRINSLMAQIGSIVGAPKAMGAISDSLNSAGEPAELTPASVKKAMSIMSKDPSAPTVNVPGVGVVANTDASASAIANNCNKILSKSGGNPSTLIKQYTGNNGLSLGTMSDQVLSALGTDAASAKSAVSSAVSGITTSVDQISSTMSSLSSAQLNTLTSGIYTRAALEARLNRMKQFKELLSESFSTIPGLSISL